MPKTKYQNFEIMIMDVKVLKEELHKELQKKQPDEAYIEEIITYGAWGDENNIVERAYNILHKSKYMDLIFLAKKGYTSVIKSMLKDPYTNPNEQNSKGETALNLASYNGHSQAVEELLKHPKIEPNVKDIHGKTALHWASYEGHSQVVQALLKHPKINPNVKDKYGDTALIEASKYGHSQAVEELLKHPKIDTSIRDKKGKTAWDVANPWDVATLKIREQFPQLKP